MPPEECPAPRGKSPEALPTAAGLPPLTGNTPGSFETKLDYKKHIEIQENVD